jgi:DNA-binding NarL/FixJ family response regulator
VDGGAEMHVVIADDSTSIRNNLRALISRVECVTEVSETANSSHTIAYVDEGLPDVLILDVNMPDGSGFEVLTYLRDRGIDMKVIVLTNYATEYHRNTALRLGADYFFDKSTEFDRIILLLRSMCR